MKTKQTSIWKKLISGSGWSLFTMFVWELIEEGIENLIALAISSVFAMFLVKALSTLAIVFATQGTKIIIKKLVMVLVPIVKKFTYKEGNDKMKLLKNYWTMVWGNKITGTFAGAGFGCISYLQTYWNFATHNWWVALIVFVIFYNLAILFGGETLKQILVRVEEKTNNKKIKQALKKVAKAQAIVDQYEEAKKTIAENQTTNNV